MGKLPASGIKLLQGHITPASNYDTAKFMGNAVPGAETSRDLSTKVKLIIYDILGREIETLINKHFTPGEYEVEFNAEGLSSGVYYYRLEAGSYNQTRKMVLLR